MKGNDRPAFAALMAGLGEVFRHKLSEAMIELYFQALEDVALEDVRAAATLCMRTGKFFPRPVELRQTIRSEVPELGDVYAELTKALWRWRPHKPPVVSDALAQLVQHMGGWDRITEMSEESRWHRARTLYEVIHDREVIEENHPYLPATDRYLLEDESDDDDEGAA